MNKGHQLKTALITVLMLLAISFANAQALSVTISSQTNASCNGQCDGSLTALASGGTGGPYTYSWAPGGQTTPTISSLCAGTFTCSVFDGVSTETVSATITQPAVFTPTATSNSPVCVGANLNLLCSGGLSWSWSGPGGFASPAQNPTITFATMASAGSYTVTATDANGCVGTATVNVVVNSLPSATFSVSNASCNGSCDGSVTATATGGTGPYSYMWNTIPVQNTPTATGLCAMTLTCTVTDNNGCVGTSTVTISEPPPVTATVTSQSNVTCNGFCDGSATASVSGGIPPYNYLWSNGAVMPAVTNAFCTGTFTCTITDSNGCQDSTTVTILQPPPLTATINSVNASCFGACDGQAQVTPNGGTASYTYQWSQGAITQIINGLCTGTYSCTVTDASSCTYTTSVIINQPAQLTVSLPSNLSICTGTSVNICASTSGGLVPYNYSWTPGPIASSCITVTPNVTTSYTVTVLDANGCAAQANTTVTVTPLPVISLVSHAEPSCLGTNGNITFTASGSPVVIFDITQISSPNTSGIFSNLATGIYMLQATDANGCVGTDNFTLLDSCEVVWPGDADNDLIANNNDILDIGLYYGSTGGTRPNANISWTGQPSPFWANTKPNGYNEKHDDCNGDGIVDASDTTAVIQNYNFVHPPYKLMASTMSGTPLSLDIVQDSTTNGGQATVRVLLGSGSVPANNVYGVALTISIDTSVVAKDSAYLNINSSWLATGSNPFLNNLIENYNNSEIDIALCRTNHTAVSGSGEIAAMSITMTDDITGKLMNNYAKSLKLEITKAKIITVTGDTIGFTASGDSIVVNQLTTPVVTVVNSEKEMKVFPNPAHDFALVKSVQKDVVGYDIFSLQGLKVIQHRTDAAANEILINTSSLEKGTYVLKVHSAEGIKTFRLQVL